VDNQVGAFGGGVWMDAVGRRKALLWSDAVFALSAVMMAVSQNVTTLLAGRFLVGLAVGLASVIAPVYISEASPPSVRARLISVNAVMICFGQFASYAVNFALVGAPDNWRWMLGVAGAPAIMQWLGLFLVPESPSWLAMHGQLESAKTALLMLRGADDDAIEDEMHALEGAQGAGAHTTPKSVWKYLQESAVQKQLALGVGLQVYQQAAGINTVMYYSTTILQMAGISDSGAVLAALPLAAVNFVGSVVGLLLIDRVGRRVLFLTSAAGVTCALISIGTVFYVLDKTDVGLSLALSEKELDNRRSSTTPWNTLLVVGLVMYLAAFSPGLNPVPWAVNAELYPSNIRGFGAGMATAMNWTANFIMCFFFLSTSDVIGRACTFWLLGGVVSFGMLVFAITMPETKGLNFLQVQELFKNQPLHVACAHVEHTNDCSTSLNALLLDRDVSPLCQEQ